MFHFLSAVMPEQYSILLVIKRRTHDDTDNLERFVTIGMPTYERFLDLQAVKEFIIVSTSDEKDDIERILCATWPTWPWRFIAEDKLLDKAIPPGWGRQQTVKLAVAMLITTDYYLIIDDDTYLTRPFSYVNLKDDGKLVMNRTLIDFPFFFLWSSRVLKCDMEKVQIEKWHMAITPEIFVTSEVRALVKWLVTTYGDHKQWQRYLANNKYTEYCLYWIWLIMQDKHKQLYNVEEQRISLYGYETTSELHDMSLHVHHSFSDNTTHYFSFVQSSIGCSLAHIKTEIDKAIKNI